MTELKESRKDLLKASQMGRYTLVALAKEWMAALMKTDEAKNVNQSDLIKKAIEDITSGRVTEADIKKGYVKESKESESEKEKVKETK